MLNLLRNKAWPIALDIGTDSIKMLQVQKVSGAVRACASARYVFPEPAPTDPKGRQELAVAAIRQMLKKGGFVGRRVVSALSCEQLSIKNIRLPQMPEKELTEAIKWEAKGRFDFDVSGDHLIYLHAGQVRQGTETGEEIILMALPDQTMDAHLRLLDEAGLKPEHIDAEPIALFRSFERFLRRKADEEAVSVIVDIGSSATRLVVARGRQVVFVKSIDIGGRKMNESVASHLNLSYSEAAELRLRTLREPPDHPAKPAEPAAVNWTLRDAVREPAEALAKELALCLRYCLVTFRGIRPDRITVTGGQAYDPALIELLQKNLNMECVVGHPLRNIDVSSVDLSGDRRGMLCEWAVCTGLAIRDVQFQTLREAEHGENRLSA